MSKREFLSSIHLSIIDSIKYYSCCNQNKIRPNLTFAEMSLLLNGIKEIDFRQVIDCVCAHLSLRSADKYIQSFSELDLNRYAVAEGFVHSAYTTIKSRSAERGKNRENSFKRMADYYRIATSCQMSTNDAIKAMICLKLARAEESDNYIADDYIDAIAYVMLLAENMATAADKEHAASYNNKIMNMRKKMERSNTDYRSLEVVYLDKVGTERRCPIAKATSNEDAISQFKEISEEMESL